MAIDQFDRENMQRQAKNIVTHFVRLVINQTTNVVDAKTPDEAINEANKLANLAGKAQQATHVWKGLVLDCEKHAKAENVAEEQKV